MALLGAHVSTAGGLEKAPERGAELGCEAIQIFTRNQMQWDAKPLVEDEIQEYHAAWKQFGKNFPVLSHDSYLINLGSPDKEKLERSRSAFLSELDRCEQLGVSCVVFHPGSHLNALSEEQCIQVIADSLNMMIQQRPELSVHILLENTAGQGSNIGYKFEHLADILEKIDDAGRERMGVCLDTCHTLAAGYDITSEEGYEMVMSNFESTVGTRWIKAFHINDSKKALSSRVDRHENIGQGFVGLKAFRCLVNDARFLQTPMVLETPGGEQSYRENLALLRSLMKA